MDYSCSRPNKQTNKQTKNIYLHIPQSFLHYFHKVRYFDGKFHYHQVENFQYLQLQLKVRYLMELVEVDFR